MIKIFTDSKNAIVKAIMLHAPTFAIILCCGCDYGLDTAFIEQRKEVQLNPDISYSSFVDSRDGQTYRFVKIGDQTWMAENLNYAADNSWCYDCNKYGRLYTWDAAMTACPGGWHLPTREEWNKLVTYAGGSNSAGKNLKSMVGWNNYGNGIDKYGFSALPGGSRDYDGGGFYDVGNYGYWWSATEYGSDRAYDRYMNYYRDSVDEGNYGRSHGFSARCVGGSQD